MADTITLTFDTPKAQRIGGIGAFGFVSGLATLSSYSQTKAALTALTGYFTPSTALLRVAHGGMSSNDYVIRWDNTAQAFRAFESASLTPALAAPAAATSITVTSSPFSYTATAPGTVLVGLNGATLASLSITRGAYGPSNLNLPTSTLLTGYHVETGDVLIATYTVATPTMEFLPAASFSATAAAVMAEAANAANVGTFDFIAIGQIAG